MSINKAEWRWYLLSVHCQWPLSPRGSGGRRLGSGPLHSATEQWPDGSMPPPLMDFVNDHFSSRCSVLTEEVTCISPLFIQAVLAHRPLWRKVKWYAYVSAANIWPCCLERFPAYSLHLDVCPFSSAFIILLEYGNVSFLHYLTIV